MSLNAEQRKQTSMELKANYQISGLTPEEVQADLGFNCRKLEDALNLNSSTDGETVWRLRDYIEQKIKVAIQSVQGQIIRNEAKLSYEKAAISAGFIPWNFSVIGKNDDVVEIYSKTVWGDKKNLQTLYSKEKADLTPLFLGNPKAEVLSEWSPFVVIEEDEDRLGIYDPRFYTNGSSFLYEYIEKK